MSNHRKEEFGLTPQVEVTYRQRLVQEGIQPKFHYYYLLRARQFIHASEGRNLPTIQSAEVGEILNKIGQELKLEEWQFNQLVDATRILLSGCLRSLSSRDIDWSNWKHADRTVQGAHPTTGREYTPEELVYLKVKKGTGEYACIRRQHKQLIVRLVTEIRTRGYAYRTEEAYEQWVVRYIAFCKGSPPDEAGADDVARYLHDLVISGNVSASTQNQALNALIFLYKHVLQAPLGQLEDFARSKRKKVVPVVLSRQEVKSVLAELEGWQQDVASLLYGTGMRLLEALTLRVKDIDFEYRRIHVCQAKGKKDRFVPLPKSLVPSLQKQIAKVHVLHQEDLESGHGDVLIPEALARKYPNASNELRWKFLYWIFDASASSRLTLLAPTQRQLSV